MSLPEPEVATASELSQEPTAAADTAVPSTTNETTNAVASTAPDVTDAAPIVAAEAAAVATEAGAVAPSDASPATESAAPPAGIVEESAPSQDVEALPTVGQENENGDQLKDQLEQVTEQMKADAAETTAVTIADDTQQEFTTEVSERQLQSPLPESTDPATGDEGFHFMNTDPGVDPEQEVILTSAAVLSRSGSTEELGGLDVDTLRIGVETPTLDTDAAIDQKEEQQQQQQPEQVQVVIAPAEPDIEIDRERVKAEIKAALEERDSMRGAHTSLQSRLVDYFRKKKSDEINVDDRERTQIDQETRYTNALANWQRLEQEFSVKRDENQVLVRQLYAQMEEKRADAAQKDAEARKFRRQTCLAASHGKTGKPILASV